MHKPLPNNMVHMAKASITLDSEAYAQVHEELAQALHKRACEKDLLRRLTCDGVSKCFRIGIKYTNITNKVSLVRAAITAKGFKAAETPGPNPTAPNATQSDFDMFVKLFLKPQGTKRPECALQLILKKLRRGVVKGLKVFKPKKGLPRGRTANAKPASTGTTESVEGNASMSPSSAAPAHQLELAQKIAEQHRRALELQKVQSKELASQISMLQAELKRLKAGQSKIAGAMAEEKKAKSLHAACKVVTNVNVREGELEERRAAEAKKAEEKRAAEAKKAEEKRAAEAMKAKEKRAAEAKKLEVKRVAAAKKAEEKKVAAAKKAEEKRVAAARKAEEKRVAAAKKAEEKRVAAAKKAEEKRVATAKKAKEREEKAEAAKVLRFTKAIEQETARELKALEKVAIQKKALEASKATGKNRTVISKKRMKWKLLDAKRKEISARIRGLKKAEKERQSLKRKAAAEAIQVERKRRRLKIEEDAIKFWHRFLAHFRKESYKVVRTTTMLSKLLNATQTVTINGATIELDDYANALAPPSDKLRKLFSEIRKDKREVKDGGKNLQGRPAKRLRTDGAAGGAVVAGSP
eukprot:g4936.t1